MTAGSWAGRRQGEVSVVARVSRPHVLCCRFGQFPWVAYLSIKGQDIDKMCAGTLISPTFVLTAGHCVDFCSMNINPDCKRTDPFPRITIKVRRTVIFILSSFVSGSPG